MGSRSRLWLVVVLLAMAALSSPIQEKVSAQSGPSGIMISEFRFSSATLSSDEYVELFNSTPTSIDISGWWLKASDNRPTPTVGDRVQIPANSVLGPGCYYLIASANYSLSATAAPDVRYAATAAFVIPDDGSIALFKPDKTTVVDQVGFRTAQAANTPFFETERLLQTPLPTAGRIYERKPNVFNGFQDTDNNVNDFVQKGAPGPQNKTTSPCLQFTTYTPHDIQGAGAVSPLSGAVRVAGVVTARKSDGFFIQTETGFEDTNPDTSEGLFVSAPPALSAPAVVGHLVKVIGGVEEFVPSRVNPGPSFTRISNVFSVEDLGVRLVPVPTLLTSALPSPAGSLAQLERLEGMRVVAPSLTAVSGTDVDGAFFAVLSSQARPIREPGVQVGEPVLPCAVAPCNIPLFDGNPERLRVDSDGLELRSTVLVSSNAVMTNVTGPLDFSARNYTLLPESLSPAGGSPIVSTPGASALQFTVASLNLGSFDAARLVKVSQAVRLVLNSPDVIGVQGVDTFGALNDLATQINNDAGVTLYQALPLGNADDGLGVGFLLKSARARALGEPELISVRASMALRVRVHGAPTLLPQDVTVIVNQFQSSTNIELNDQTGAAVRARRRAQAEAVANYVQSRQSGGSGELIVALGDFNAFDFNDGYVDVVGTVRGVPAPGTQVVLASPSLVSPALVNADFLNAPLERYSSVSNGNAQSLDHVLVSASALSQLRRLRHARVNADFPETLRDDATTPVRFSDRDPLVAYFTFPPDLEPPVFDVPPQNVTVEALNADGAVATFATPTAHDNLDPSVNVSCDPESGTTFPLDNTAVTCFAQDAAGNTSSVSFTVSVHDSTAPQLSMPVDQVAEATSSNGAVVTFAVTATDAVTANPTVDCSPWSSGSTFPLHNTLVTCSTHDDAGNSTSATFNVLVRDTTPPQVSVPVEQVAEATSNTGAIVNFSATATDLVTSELNVVCTPLGSGSTFPMGNTAVRCTAHDDAGNEGSASFNVRVEDTTAPNLSTSGNQVVEATSSNGAVATFTTTATDAVTAELSVDCSPWTSGSTFPLGTTHVSCTTHDNAGNSAEASFNVTVRDTIAPAVSVSEDKVAEASSAAGAVVTFTDATATDAVTSSLTIVCSRASGSTFALGTTVVTCSADDAAHNHGSASFNVTVQDTTAPVVSVSADKTAEATSAAGAVVTFNAASATDAVTSPLNIVCSRASGSTFGLGTTTVDCSATDAAGNTGSASFHVTVRDTTAPTISVPLVAPTEAASASGAVVTYSASANDAVTSSPAVWCLPLSGSTFAIGDTLVTCTTEDAAHNPAAATFTVRVQDTTAPVFLLPSNITEEATSSAGRIINYVASSADLVTALPTLSCAPASGSNFPVGQTTVSCTTSDAANNTALGSFTVTITPPAAASLVGRMAGAGRVVIGQKDTWFAFDVRRSSQGVEHGSIALMVRDGYGRPNRFVALSASNVVFSNSEGYEPGRFPRSGVDTVSFTGYGSWNGQSGYRFEVLGTDRGEPGRNVDTFTVKVYAPNGTVVESSNATLRDGNIQSLR